MCNPRRDLDCQCLYGDCGLASVNGVVNFNMGQIGATSFQVNKFGLAGGLFGGDQIKSVVIDFQMKCPDLTLHDATVRFGNQEISLVFDGLADFIPISSGR